MSPATSTLASRLAEARRRIAAAAGRRGRDPQAVTLVVVTKSAPAGVFGLAAAAGVRDVGENRVQAGLQRREGREDSFRWHLIGSLQGNKARAAAGAFDVLHGIDSAPLLLRVERAAAELGRRPEVFLQVNVSGEASKHGLSPAELPAALDAARGLRHARLVGLMTMAPASDDPAAARPVFAALRELRDRHAPELRELSMGMSDDFEVAIEEGATCVRLGRCLVADLPELAGAEAHR